MHKNQRRLPLGKNTERFVVNSLKLAGAQVKTSIELDHNYKIDFLILLNNLVYGVQLSLKQDQLKAKISKICALDIVPRFIYLSLSKHLITKTDIQYGKDLRRILSNVSINHSQPALWIHIDMNGVHIKNI